jgi:hypothetical protein
MFVMDLTQIVVIGVVVAAAQTLLLVIAGVVIWRQQRAAQRSEYVETITRIFDDLGSRESYKDADAALGLPSRIEDYTPEELELATWTTSVYEKVAFLVESGMIPEPYIVPLYSRRIVWTWDALQPYIQEQRRLRDSGGGYRISGDGRYFELLARRALRYRGRAFGDAKRKHPPIPAEYRERVRQLIARGERIGSGGGR